MIGLLRASIWLFLRVYGFFFIAVAVVACVALVLLLVGAAGYALYRRRRQSYSIPTVVTRAKDDGPVRISLPKQRTL